MDVLIIGGTGAIGASLTRIVAGFASRVVVTSRQSRNSFSNIQYVQGDAKDPVFLAVLLQEHWDAIIDFMIYSTQDFVAKIDLFLSSTDQYLYLSSARVYADSNGLLFEDSPRLLDVSKDTRFLATDAYPLAKARQEDCLYNSGKKNWTIVRPYITYSSSRLQLGVLEKEAWLYRGLCGRKIVFSEDMAKCQTTLTDGRDVARAIAKLIGQDAALGEAFHITGASPRSWESILALYERAASESGANLKFKNVDLSQFIRCHNGKYQVIYDRIYDRVFDNSKINQFIDTSCFMVPEEGLYQATIDFLQNPKFLAIDWSYEGIKDKISGEMANLGRTGSLVNAMKYLKYRFIK